ncbi:LSU ribosomal protein L15p (L27Ae), partial [Pseudomonas sp. FEN]
GRRHRHRAVPERCQRDQPERTACENHAVGRSDSRSNYQGIAATKGARAAIEAAAASSRNKWL